MPNAGPAWWMWPAATLVNAIAETKYRGAVAACGLAQSDALHGSVLPFILRNVTWPAWIR